MSGPSTEEIESELLVMFGDIKRCDARVDLDGSRDVVGRLGLDSLDVIEVCVRLDRLYGIEMGTRAADLDALSNLDDLVALVAARRTR